MNLSISKQNILIETLQETKKDYEKYHNKVVNKINKKITSKKKFNEYLHGLTLDELKEIRRFWCITGTSTLKKDELVAIIEKHILENISEILDIFDEERFNLLLKIASNDGYTNVKGLMSVNLSYLRKTGIVFLGVIKDELSIVLPLEIMEIVNQWSSDSKVKEQIKANERVVKTINGILYHYGVIKENQLFNVFKGISKIDISKDMLIKIVMNRYAYAKDFNVGEELVSNLEAKNPKGILEIQENSKIAYAYLGEEQVIEIGTKGYIENSKEKMQLMDIITKNYKISNKEVEEIANNCIYMMKNGKLVMEVSEYINRLFVISDMNIYSKLIKAAGNLFNNTRVWTLKGNTPEEVRLMEEKKFDISKTIGRNDPCTCGSGKKYKKCCGKI